jgi:hypothetical protein
VAAPQFQDLLRSTRSEVDAVLADVPSSLLEARRLITREMQFEPRPEELQAIVKIAGFTSTSVFCYELPRQMLALRVMAERELGDHWDERRLSAEKLAHAGTLIEELLRTNELAQADLAVDAEAMATVSDEERAYLKYVGEVIAVPKSRLEAAAILVPRLEFVAKLVTTGNLSEMLPGLDDHEIEMFSQAVHLESDGPARVCLEAVALRTIFAEYLSVWERSGYLEDAELIQQLQEGIREQLREAETAYRVVNERLQVQQDEALSASLEEFAKEIRTAKSKLFETYVKTQPLMRQAEAVEFGSEDGARSLADTLADAEVADEQAGSSRERSDELYLNALTSLRQDRAAGRDMSMHPLAVARRRHKRKLWTMAATIGVLSLAAIAVQWIFPNPVPDPITVSLKEFEPSLSVIDAKPIGSMLYVRVTDWDNLTVQSTRFRASEIGEVASAKGLSLAYIVSDDGRGLAEWHTNGGVLVKSHSAGVDVISQAEQRARQSLEGSTNDK